MQPAVASVCWTALHGRLATGPAPSSPSPCTHPPKQRRTKLHMRMTRQGAAKRTAYLLPSQLRLQFAFLHLPLNDQRLVLEISSKVSQGGFSFLLRGCCGLGGSCEPGDFPFQQLRNEHAKSKEGHEAGARDKTSIPPRLSTKELALASRGHAEYALPLAPVIARFMTHRKRKRCA